MELERLRELIDAYGADPHRWPEGEREEAAVFAEGSPEAQRLQAEARRLDAVLAQAPDPALSPTLGTKILALADTPQDRPGSAAILPFRLNPSFLLPRLTSLAAAGILGFMVGGSMVGESNYPGTNSEDNRVDISALIYGTDLEEEDWL